MISFEELRVVHQNAPWFFPTLAALLGACVGSFLNVCIYRIPAEKSVVSPGSRCGCGQPIAWYDNIPVLSWLILRGRARCCGRKFSVRYPAIELLTAALFLICALQFAPGKAVCAMVFVSLLIVGSFIDIDHLELPDGVTIWGMVTGVIASVLVPGLHGSHHEVFLAASFQSGISAIVGAFIGSALVLWILLLAEKILRKEGMGFGDVTLLGCIGAFTGWQGAIFTVFGGAFVGLAGHLVILAFAGKKAFASYQPAAEPDGEKPAADGPENGSMRVPFGPALAVASLLYLLWLQPWVDAQFAEVARELTR